jgi:lysophospholipase L1-like esterase
MPIVDRRRALALALVALLGGVAAGSLWWAGHGEAAAPSVYVALGASDAVGIGAKVPSRDGWVSQVHDGLDDGTQLVNLGVNGATLADILQLELPVAVDAHPSLVTIWPGVNDLRGGVPLDAFAERLDSLLGALSALDDVTVIVVNIPDLRFVPAFDAIGPDALDAHVRDWNATIADAATRHGAHIVDVYGPGLELAAHPEYVSADGFHPSNDGYRRIAELTLAVIEGQRAAASE